MSCTVTTGDDPVTIQWYKEDIPLASSSKFLINKVDSKMNFLILRDVGSDHTGTYTCLAFNPFGRQRFSAQLWVKGNDLLLFFVILHGVLIAFHSIPIIYQSFISVHWKLHMRACSEVVVLALLMDSYNVVVLIY